MSEWPSGVIVDPHTMEQVMENYCKNDNNNNKRLITMASAITKNIPRIGKLPYGAK